MTDQRDVILVYIGLVLQLGGGAAAALIVAAELPLTAVNFGLLILALLIVGLGRIVVRRGERRRVDIQETERTE